MNLKRVVVTGMGAITPLGHNITDTWQQLRQGLGAMNCALVMA